MDTFWAGLLGAVVGGVFTLLGAWFQGRTTLQATVAQAAAVVEANRLQREAIVRQAAYREVLGRVAGIGRFYSLKDLDWQVNDEMMRGFYRQFMDSDTQRMIDELDAMFAPGQFRPKRDDVEQRVREFIYHLHDKITEDRLANPEPRGP